ncbi:type II toxin-antitoxin system YafQ family toxin [Verminephrobacter eiseniae]|uniref:type II toxin-antitoxin system YafQ family toxin n=1 Tax=Verminephrobacter eiseniae TaxID=364317 RepID=UPI002238AE2E|nr:type II toxin-antitoxin system YafQ family toxin [Verminephrobacter eiseniae]
MVLTLVREGGRRKVARTFAQIGRASAHPEATGAASAAPPKGNEPLACAFTLSPSSHRACHIGDACLLICQSDIDILNFMRAGLHTDLFTE